MEIKKLQAIANKKSRIVAGVISGTSVDRISVAICNIQGGGISSNTKIKLLHFSSYPYLKKTRAQLINPLNLRTKDISELNVIVGQEFAKAILLACKKSGVNSKKIDLIGSHGQTIFHHSSQGNGVKSTLQIGDGDIIAQATDTNVISDFRMQDIAAGGEGAPLTPYTDAILYKSSDQTKRAVLNLGGIANLTFLDHPKRITGFDCGPANGPLDRLARILSKNKLEFDKNGLLARKGEINKKFLDYLLNSDKFIGKIPPKSTGQEIYGERFIQQIIKKYGRADNDLLTTVTEFCALAVSINLKLFGSAAIKELIVAGGGIHNKYLIERIAHNIHPIKVRSSDDFGVPVDAREAMAFAILANDALLGIPTSLRSVTGAKNARVLGRLSWC